jgi:polar amino acid transport system substrate-binding protein
VVVLTVIALAVAGCGSSAAPESVSVAPVEPRPSGAAEVTAAPAAANADCDREASSPAQRPLPSPGAMPAGSTMARIAERGRLIVGVDQNTYLFGFRNPATGQLEGFDIDIAREVARAIFGDPNRIELRVVDASQRESVLQNDEVDLVVRTYSITCARKQRSRSRPCTSTPTRRFSR